MGLDTMMRNLTLTGGAAPARAYIEVPDGYKAMAEREALKLLIRP
jgi:hypothetical protein